MADIHTEEITYMGNGIEMKGYIAWDSNAEGPRPGVLVVHEWWGRNDYAQRRARMLAEAGYTGLALDLYGDGRIAADPDEAGELMNARIDDMEGTRARFTAALDALIAHPNVDGNRTGAIGYCFGGGVVTHMARMGLPLDITGSFHGAVGLAAVDGPDHIDCRIMVYNGEADVLIDEDQIAGFKAEMAKTDANYDFIQLPGALHGFSNPIATSNGQKYGLPLAYNALADESSWAHLRLTMEHVFAQ
ncbi:MAG: dienelactone hydrolase family protein [Gammaproteobacteria bacterium]|nr:MAG: dienelactone hydrolase family protein [Gammaproteobacteria bacterium]